MLATRTNGEVSAARREGVRSAEERLGWSPKWCGLWSRWGNICGTLLFIFDNLYTNLLIIHLIYFVNNHYYYRSTEIPFQGTCVKFGKVTISRMIWLLDSLLQECFRISQTELLQRLMKSGWFHLFHRKGQKMLTCFWITPCFFERDSLLPSVPQALGNSKSKCKRILTVGVCPALLY